MSNGEFLHLFNLKGIRIFIKIEAKLLCFETEKIYVVFKVVIYVHAFFERKLYNSLKLKE